MGILETIKPKILSLQKIPFVSPVIAAQFDVDPGHISLGLLTVTSDHALFTALDQATKDSDAEVAYRHSFYGGNKYPSGPLSGEVIGIFSGNDPVVIENALRSTVDYLNEKAFFVSANNDNSLIFFPHVIGSIGRFLSKESGIQEGEAMAYLVAPPIEATVALDYAIKNSDTTLVKFFKPPTPTNFSGAYLTGTISDCQAAAEAFTEKILEIAVNPIVNI